MMVIMRLLDECVLATGVVMMIVMMLLSSEVDAHGRLLEPPSRASAWRRGFDTPVNYNDNQLYCGGFQNQWEVNGGRCGVCGDPYQGPREYEAGGKYATGTIVRHYGKGTVIRVTVQLTANHRGWMEFRLCPNNDPNKAVTQECLDRHLLTSLGESRYPVSPEDRLIQLDLALPSDVTCTQCVLQWKYNAGNSWGRDETTGHGCIGCGPQEQFYGCADISIADTLHSELVA